MQKLASSLPQRCRLLRLLPAACLLAVRLRRLMLLRLRLWQLLLPLLVAPGMLRWLLPVLLSFWCWLRLVPLVMVLLVRLRLPLLPLLAPLAARGCFPLLGAPALKRICCVMLRLQHTMLHAQALSERVVLLLVITILQGAIMRRCIRCNLLPVSVRCMVAHGLLCVRCILMFLIPSLLPLCLLLLWIQSLM